MSPVRRRTSTPLGPNCAQQPAVWGECLGPLRSCDHQVVSATAVERKGGQQAGGTGQGPNAHGAIEAGGEKPAVVGQEANAPDKVSATHRHVHGSAGRRIPDVNGTAAADGDDVSVILT